MSPVVLAPAPAAAYRRARDAGAPAGVTSSTRTRAEQEHLYALFLAGRGAIASKPGLSRHEAGYALDIPQPARAWFQVNGAEYGWVRTNEEPWHFEYQIGRDRHLLEATKLPTEPLPQEEDDMIVIAQRKAQYNDPYIWRGNGIIRTHIPDIPALNDLIAMIKSGVLKGDPTIHRVDDLDWLGKEV